MIHNRLGVLRPYHYKHVIWEFLGTELSIGMGMDGALDGGSPCRLSILRNANVACFCRLFMAMSGVEFKK